MKRLLIPSILLLFGGMYWVYFHIVGEFTKADLGPLGDFIGGNINPLFTFISTILLIDTVLSNARLLMTQSNLKKKRVIR